MGEAERRAKAKEHAQSEAKTSGGSNPAVDEEDTFVRCTLIENEEAIFGTAVRLLDRGEPLIEVFQNGRPIAHVIDIDSKMLREQLKIASRPGRSLEAAVASVTASPEFAVRVTP